MASGPQLTYEVPGPQGKSRKQQGPPDIAVKMPFFWFHGTITVEDAERILRANSLCDGLFIVRQDKQKRIWLNMSYQGRLHTTQEGQGVQVIKDIGIPNKPRFFVGGAFVVCLTLIRILTTTHPNIMFLPQQLACKCPTMF